jgi:predicted DNA-binding protein YlxM (UPF0122 family)
MDKKTAEWYDYIEELVEKYQQGDSESGLTLINAFEPYMKKYSRMIKDGCIDLKDDDSRKFISLFITDYNTRINLIKHPQSKEARSAAYSAISMLTKVCQSITIEDLKQDFCVILLSLCKRYVKQNDGANFCGYTYNTFRYEIHRRIIDIVKDPLAFMSDFNISFDETQYITQDTDTYIDNEEISNVPMAIEDDELGNNWIRGLSCDDMFYNLTPLQRLILKKYYIEGYSDPKIADKLCMHKNTIYRNRMKAEDVIAKYMGKNYIDILRAKRDNKTNVRNNDDEIN